jgi:hypothetical protein
MVQIVDKVLIYLIINTLIIINNRKDNSMRRLFRATGWLAVFFCLQAQAANKIDSNGDGIISKAEFCAAHAKQAEVSGKAYEQKKVDSRFNQLDINKDGCLSEAEADSLSQKKKKEPSHTKE